MHKKQTPLAELGAVERRNGGYCSHIQFRDGKGTKNHIRGPDRLDEARTKTDLAQIRAAGAVGRTRDEGLLIMNAEARRIRDIAEHEAENIAKEMRFRAEDEAEEGFIGFVSGSDSEFDEEPWMNDDYEVPKPASPTPPSQRRHLTPSEAVAEMKTFRPFRSHPSDLEHLLACRADPNYQPEPGFSTLRNVLMLARAPHVAEMRAILLKYGATESNYERERWISRQECDRCEEIRLKAEREIADERRYCPTAATMEMAS